MALSDRDQREIEELRIIELKRNLRAAEERLARLQEPNLAEPIAARAVVRFRLRMRRRGSTHWGTYDFAAIKVGTGRWYTTGSTCPVNGHTWKQLWDFIRQHELVAIEEMVPRSEAETPF